MFKVQEDIIDLVKIMAGLSQFYVFICYIIKRSGPVVECLTRDQRATGSSLTGVPVLCHSARHINPSIVLFQPRKTGPFKTERLLMGHKESNQTKIKCCNILMCYL